MRDFTPEEKELIVNTPMTFECFDMDDFEEINIFKKLNYLQDEWITSKDLWGKLITYLERLRTEYNETKDERYFIELVRVLPNSYKVVKL